MPKDQEISNGNGFGVDAEITSIMGTSKFDFCPFPFVIFFPVEKTMKKCTIIRVKENIYLRR